MAPHRRNIWAAAGPYISTVSVDTLNAGGRPVQARPRKRQHPACGARYRPHLDRGAGAGTSPASSTRPACGTIARDASEIVATKNVEITAPTSGLLGRWGLNENGGTSAGDSAGNSISGTIVGSPTPVAGFVPPDSTPPAAPTGLAAAGGTCGIDLTWDANSEPDVAGYNVYRGTSPEVGTGGGRINGALLTSPASHRSR